MTPKKLILVVLVFMAPALGVNAEAAARDISLHGAHAINLSEDRSEFASPEFDDSAWTRIAVPSSLRAAGLAGRPDVFWYRISFDVPKDWASEAPAIRLGIITRSDETYLNGVRIGGHGIVGQALSDWHSYAPTLPRLYPFDPALLRPGETNVLAIRGAREPYIDDGGIIAGPVALTTLPGAIESFDALQTRFIILRSVLAGIETLVALVLLACLIIGIRSRLLLLFQLFYLPSYIFFLEYRGILAMLGFESEALQFAANISGALALPLLLEIVSHVFNRRLGLWGRGLQAASVLTLISIPNTGIAVLDWWAIESNLVWHALMLGALGVASVWSVQAAFQQKRYSGAMVAGLICLTAGLATDIVFPLNYFEQRIGLRIAEIGMLFFFLSIGSMVLQSLIERERALRAANRDIAFLHEQDRAAMAHDIHDGIGQWLAAIKIKLDMLAKTVPPTEPIDGSPRMPQLQDLAADVDQVITDTRRLAHRLSPELLAQHGLIGAMQANAQVVQSIMAVSFTASAPGGIALSATDQVHAYRIFQEALSNAVQHSGAQQLQVDISQDKNWFRMEIEDDGDWLPAGNRLKDAGGGAAGAGLGMRSMFSRAQLMNGELEIRSLGQNGTLISLAVPTGSIDRA